MISKSRNVQHKASSLVDRQKKERRRAVLEAAKMLIKKQGYDQTTMEGLANYAGLSTQTVYNYFGTKLDVLMELYIEDRDLAYSAILKLVGDVSSDPVDLLMKILAADLHQEVDAVSHALWRQVAAAEVTETAGKHFEIFQRLNQRYWDIVLVIFEQLVAQGRFRKSLDVKTATDVFIGINEAIYRRVIATRDTPFDNFQADARRQVELFVTACRP